MKRKVKKHLKKDIATFEREAKEDKRLLRELNGKKSKKEEKIADVMHEFKEGELHSGSKKGPVVKKRDQAIAIAINESRKKKKK